MKDILMQQIELNEKYHDVKEKMAWTAATLYLAFSIAAIKWILGSYPPAENNECLVFWLLLFVIWTVYLAGLMFVRFQFRMRWNSVRKSEELKAVLRSCRADRGPAGYVAERDKATARFDKDPRHKREGGRAFWRPIWMTALFPIGGFLWLVVNDPKNYKGGPKDSRYATEIPTYALMTYLMAAQVVLLIIRFVC